MHAPTPPSFDSVLLEFPRFQYPVMFEEKPYTTAPFSATLAGTSVDAATQATGAANGAMASPAAKRTATTAVGVPSGAHINLVFDPETGTDNPVSHKYHKVGSDSCAAVGVCALTRLVVVCALFHSWPGDSSVQPHTGALLSILS